MSTFDHSRTVRNRFSANAQQYANYAHIQRELAERLADLMAAEPVPSPVLEVGCGTGLLTQRLLRKWPKIEIHALDIAPEMVRKAEQFLAGSSTIRWIIADAAHYSTPTRYSLIASNCALHWLYPFRSGLGSLLSLLAPGGYFAAAVMLDGTLSELRASRLRAAPSKPPIGRLPTLNDVEHILAENGMTLLYSAEERKRASYISARDVLTMVHNQGLTGGHVSRSHSPLTRGEINGLVNEYETSFRTSDGFVQASYCAGFFIAQKPDSAHE